MRGHLLLRLAFLTDHVQPFLQLKVRYSNQPDKLNYLQIYVTIQVMLWLNQRQVVIQYSVRESHSYYQDENLAS